MNDFANKTVLGTAIAIRSNELILCGCEAERRVEAFCFVTNKLFSLRARLTSIFELRKVWLSVKIFTSATNVITKNCLTIA